MAFPGRHSSTAWERKGYVSGFLAGVSGHSARQYGITICFVMLFG